MPIGDMWFCAVINCPNQCTKSSENLFHRFPADEAISKKWLMRCGRKVNSDISELFVCSAHFSDDDYASFTGTGLSSCHKRTRLKQEAIPHLNLFKIKQEHSDANDVEILECTTLSSSMSCPNVPSSQSIVCTRLDDAAFDNGAAIGVSTTTFNEEMVPLEPVESTSISMDIKEEPSTSSSINYIPSSLPASQNWAGEYDFAVSFGPQEKTTKGVSWTYSKQKDKLYVGKDMPCPVNFSVNATMLDDVTIRALALYSSPEHTSEIVHRCVNHSMDELQRGIFEAEHLVRCESSMAAYDVNKTTQRHSVVVPFENPPAGQYFSTYIYKFACFGSCSGGPNRRPLMLIFSLEKGGRVIGRRKLDVKICACPGRDRKTEEKVLGEQDSPVSAKRKEPELMSLSSAMDFTQSVMFPPAKKSKVSPNEEGYYLVKTHDKECYDFLKQMKKLYDICKTMKNLTPEVKKSLLNLSRKKTSDPED